MERPPAHVLVVDDDPGIRTLLGEYLERAGFRVSLARDGREMRHALDASRPDLVVLDVMLHRHIKEGQYISGSGFHRSITRWALQGRNPCLDLP